MARFARVIASGIPHHVSQRGKRRQTRYFCEEDYACYLELMAEPCRIENAEILACYLVAKCVHLIEVSQSADGIRRAIGETYWLAGAPVAGAFRIVRSR